jgi:hypothetical protein
LSTLTVTAEAVIARVIAVAKSRRRTVATSALLARSRVATIGVVKIESFSPREKGSGGWGASEPAKYSPRIPPRN